MFHLRPFEDPQVRIQGCCIQVYGLSELSSLQRRPPGTWAQRDLCMYFILLSLAPFSLEGYPAFHQHGNDPFKLNSTQYSLNNTREMLIK
jgi:hypothetical protein